MLIFLRHGQTTTNAQQLLVGRSDPALTELGRAQARALASWLSGVQEVWTSPLQRARETAALAMPALEATVREEFIEVDYGVYDGQSVSLMASDEWRAYFTDHARRFDGGESFADVDARVHPVLAALLDDEDSLVHDPERHLAVVSHVSPIKSALTWALGVEGATHWRTRLDNGSLTMIGARRGQPTLIRFNAVPGR